MISPLTVFPPPTTQPAFGQYCAWIEWHLFVVLNSLSNSNHYTKLNCRNEKIHRHDII